MKNLYIIFCLFTAVVFSSCDEIKGPYEEYPEIPPGDRKILLEDFTGHQCGNCPDAAKEAMKIDSIYKGRIIIVATHVGFFADTNKTGKFTYNFKTPPGDQIDADYGNIGDALPKGMVNRVKYNNKYVLNWGDWSTVVAQQLAIAPDVNIKLENTYDATERNLKVDVEVAYVKQGKPNQKLVIYLVEDSIVNWQKQYNPPLGDIPNYVHRHVLRKALTPVYGDVLSSGETIPGKTIKKTYDNIKISTAYNQEHCHIVAFVIEDKGNDTNPAVPNRPVLQVEEKKLME